PISIPTWTDNPYHRLPRLRPVLHRPSPTHRRTGDSAPQGPPPARPRPASGRGAARPRRRRPRRRAPPGRRPAPAAGGGGRGRAGAPGGGGGERRTAGGRGAERPAETLSGDRDPPPAATYRPDQSGCDGRRTVEGLLRLRP